MQSHATQMQQQNAQMQQQHGQMQHQSVILTKLSEQLSQLGTKEASQEGEHSANTPEQGESRLAGKKVKLPLFDGDDPVAWITRAEIYFDVQNTIDEMRVKLARLSMEGSTIHWFNLLMETEDDLSWEKLKRALIARYGG
ncbi:retrotransposon gag protein, partial [Trifolium medium]|nr:retrotransposon gag protein [Trifolium medium]